MILSYYTTGSSFIEESTVACIFIHEHIFLLTELSIDISPQNFHYKFNNITFMRNFVILYPITKTFVHMNIENLLVSYMFILKQHMFDCLYKVHQIFKRGEFLFLQPEHNVNS